jgi:uncharacterized circularly permuted ATP-grasp superfamily protein
LTEIERANDVTVINLVGETHLSDKAINEWLPTLEAILEDLDRDFGLA